MWQRCAISKQNLVWGIKMINIKIIYEDGDCEFTKINATIEEARKYYTGQRFNVGITTDKIKKCVKVEIINSK